MAKQNKNSKKPSKPSKPATAKEAKAEANTPKDAPKTSCSKFPSFSR